MEATKCKHDWLVITDYEKVWFMIFVYIDRKSEKAVCLKCGKEVRP